MLQNWHTNNEPWRHQTTKSTVCGEHLQLRYSSCNATFVCVFLANTWTVVPLQPKLSTGGLQRTHILMFDQKIFCKQYNKWTNQKSYFINRYLQSNHYVIWICWVILYHKLCAAENKHGPWGNRCIQMVQIVVIDTILKYNHISRWKLFFTFISSRTPSKHFHILKAV